MKQAICLCLLVALLLCGCVQDTKPTEPTVPETTIPETTVPETTIPETTVPEETKPEHSELYIPGVPVEDVITWFNEVCLDGEYIHSGDPSVVQKWSEPICYSIEGDSTPEDLAILEDFALSLNEIAGFPGISMAQPDEWVNLRIHFTDATGLTDIMGPDYVNLDGAVTFWYDQNNEIYDSIICIRTDLDQYLRNSVILEELYNCLGPIQDTQLRPDSIIWQDFAEPQSLTEEDWLILKLLYHPDILCGMDASECEAVIRELYY